MPRWPDDTGGRLRAAALELFVQQGYAATTVDEIAARAGVSQRTFFRHFGDKEEVLFAEDAALLAVLGGEVEAADPAAPPLTAVRAGLLALARSFEAEEKAAHQDRAAVVISNPALRGRELLKRSRWEAELARLLVTRGCPPLRAATLAGTAAAAFRVAYEAWLRDPSPVSLTDRVASVLADLLDALAPT